MYFLTLATDYDGTLAEDSGVSDETLSALERLRETGRKLILVTGRELPDLKRVFSRLDLFDKVVAENGALLYTPKTEEERTLASAPPAAFVERLIEKGVGPISVGRSIVATWEPHQTAALEAIKELGLELEIIFNKGAVMILPSGINKASGLQAALAELELSAHNVVGIGDAENDHAFLRACGCSVAVANALPAVKDTADLVTRGARGAGVEELVAKLMTSDEDLDPGQRHRIAVGKDVTGRVVDIGPKDVVLIAGSSGIGKSTLAMALTERFIEKSFQFCVFDPEGDYQELEGAVSLGDADTPPSTAQVLELLANPSNNVVVNTLALELRERPQFFSELMPELSKLRARTGRPHWLVIDEAHHLVPKSRDSASLALSNDVPGTILITVHPDSVSADALSLITAMLALGPQAPDVITTYCEAVGDLPPADLPSPGEDEVLFWQRGSSSPVRAIAAEKPRQAHKRHTRKYAEGELDEERSFYFRGPHDEMNLRAQNLMLFLQIGEGIDDRTWEHHLRAGDYSEWFRTRIGDDELADEAAEVESNSGLSAAESRKRIAAAVRRRYTAPASR